MDSFTQATAHTENLGCCGQILAALVTDAIQPSISLQARTIQCACAVVRIVLCRFIEGLDVCALDTDPCPRSRDWSYCALISQGAGLSCLWPLTPHYLLTPVPQVWRAQWQTFRRCIEMGCIEICSYANEHGKKSWDVLKWDVLKSVGRKYEKGKLVKYKSDQ